MNQSGVHGGGDPRVRSRVPEGAAWAERCVAGRRRVSYDALRRWQSSVFDGDLDRGLIPREGSQMTVPPGKRTALEKARAAEREAYVAEVTHLSARVRELEETNTALGKAIGLLHAMSEEEPAHNPTANEDLREVHNVLIAPEVLA